VIANEAKKTTTSEGKKNWGDWCRSKEQAVVSCRDEQQKGNTRTQKQR